MVAFCGINFLLGSRRFGLYFFVLRVCTALHLRCLHLNSSSSYNVRIKDRCTHSELALLGLHFKSCFHQLLEYHIQMLQMFLLCITEHYQVIKVGTGKSSQPSLRHLNYVPTLTLLQCTQCPPVHRRIYESSHWLVMSNTAFRSHSKVSAASTYK